MRKHKHIGEIVKDVIRKVDKKGRISKEEMAEIWSSAVGERAAMHTRPESLRKNSLFVNVDGSSWLYELTLKKKEIVKNLEGKMKGRLLKDIRFRIGEVA